MVEEAVRRWGRLDILDNNVGIGGRATVVDVDEKDWDHLMRVNVTSMMLTSTSHPPYLGGDEPAATRRDLTQHAFSAS